MEEKPKSVGRGTKLLEKMKAMAPGKFEEGESSSKASEDTSKPHDVGVEKSADPKPGGRAHLLSQLKYLSLKSQESTASETGVAGAAKPEAKKGRGLLAELAKKQRLLQVGRSETELPVSEEQAISTVSVEKKPELPVESEEFESAPVIRRGEMGEKVDIAVNYVTLKTDPGKGVFEYEVRFSPEVDYAAFRYKLINQHFKANKGIRCYDGGDKLFMPEKLSSEKVIIDSQHPNDASPVQIIITFKRQMRLKECSQLYNILINNCSKVLNLTRLGRQHYDFKLSHQIPQHKLEVWPGYITAVEEFEGGIHLCCDIRHRVLRTDTAYDIITNLAHHDPVNYKSLIVKELVGQCVLTRYNNNLYRVDDIDWDKSPMSTFQLASGENITFLEYYKKQYDLDIADLNQPLLINKRKAERSGTFRLICIVPELCNLTGLTDKMRKDMRVMKEIATYTRVTPAQRHLGFRKFLENITSNTRAQEMLSDWGLKIDKEPLKTAARILPPENLVLQNNAKYSTPQNLEWSKYLQTYGVFRSISIKYWLLIHTKKDTNFAHTLWNMLVKVGPGLGLDICDPKLFAIADDRIDYYIRAIKENLASHIQMVLCLCPTSRDDRYSAIKKLCCRDLPVLSQIVNTGTVAKEKRLRSVVQNIALQMNNKIGGASWTVPIPLKNTMICGIDTYHDSDRKSSSVGAFVASVDAEFTQWYSKTCIQQPKQELVDGLTSCFAYSLRKYLEINTVLPERVVIFRDGVGDGQLPVVQNFEVSQFLETFEMISKRYKPKFSFVVVQKRINTKFYQFSNGGYEDLVNPRSGCILDHTVTRRNYYDFFLVSQYVTCGTATPSHYIVLYDTSELKPDLMQKLTYKCCHLYYNWAGTIRVPAPCQYAHKLAQLVGQNIKELPKEVLDDKLFYL